MDPNESKQLDENGSQFIPIHTNGSQWIPRNLDGSKLIRMDPNWTKWIPINPHYAELFVILFFPGARCDPMENDNNCCTLKNKCLVGQGDCDRDDQCAESLVCGSNNCRRWSPDAIGNFDCCEDPGIVFLESDWGSRSRFEIFCKILKTVLWEASHCVTKVH